MLEEKILEATATAFITELSQEIKSAYRGVTSEAKQILEIGIKEYIQNQYKRFKYVKTILRGNTPNYFYDVYHPINITNSNHKAITNSINSTFEKSNFITVIGVAGSGKSTLAKHLFLTALSEKNAIPLFLELRQLTNDPNTIEKHIKEKILESRLSESTRILERMLGSGKFLFFLDGYDEISGEAKSNITTSINKFIEKYPNNKYLLTTRPYSDIELLPLFHNYKIEQLSETEITKFIDKQLKDEPELAKKINQSIKDSKAAYIKSFLRNPLLLSLYILTYQSNSSIPSKKYVFYRRVINALFSEHDSKSKLGYERETRCKLQQEEFEKILKAFCFVSYFDSAFHFEHDALISRLQTIKTKIPGVRFSPANFTLDMKVAISLWVEDGGITSFAHRSLQEYFAALFIKDLESHEKEIIYNKIISESQTARRLNEIENFLSLCEEMDEPNFNKYYAIPILEELKSKIEGRDPLAKFLDFFCDGINQTIYHMRKGKNFNKFYPIVKAEVYKSIYFHIKYTLKLHDKISKSSPEILFPEGVPAINEESPHSIHLFRKTKGLRSKLLTELKKQDGMKLAKDFATYIDKEIAKRSENINQQKRSNSDLINLIADYQN